MKKDIILKLFIIFILGFAFRTWCLDKPEGLYFDEYFGWFIASKNTFAEFIKAVMQNCHTPLYYIYLKIWMFLFSDSDISLRFSSLIPSLFSILTMFLLGKEFKNKNLGLFAALITACSSFCIYFAQEVRFYSILFLLSSLAFLYFIKSVKNPNKLNFTLFFTFNALICAFHTLGIIFSFFLILSLAIYFYKYLPQYRNNIIKISNLIKYISPFIIIIILLSPFLFNIALSKNLSQFWSDFSHLKILCIFIDYFSPVQTNIVNTLSTFYEYTHINDKINYLFYIFAINPLIIGFLALIRAISEKNKILNYMLSASALFLVVVIILSFFGKLILITKYTVEIYPILILAFCFGISLFSSKIYKILLISIYLFINLFYLITSNDSAPKKTRPEGHRAVVELLKHSRLKSTDYVLLTYYDKDKFEKYLTDNINYNFYSINKYNFNYVLFNEENYDKVITEGKNTYKVLLREYPNEAVLSYINNNFINNMKKGDRLGIVILDSVSFFRNQELQNIVDNEEKYRKTPFIFLIFSSLRNSAIYVCKKQLKLDTITHAGYWT